MSEMVAVVQARGAGLRWLHWLVIGLAGAILIGFIGLIPMSSWRADEYHDFGLYRLRGWSFFFQRLLTWSPRPLSEVIAGLYFLLEEGTGRQLITSFLATLWVPLLVGPVLYLRRGADASRILIAAAILCLFLLGHGVAEVFYWPMGAVAYATTLAAISAIAFHVVDGRWRRGRGQAFCVACLLCAAASAELGAIFAIFFAGSMLLLHGIGKIGERRDALPWLLPLALGVLVMIMLTLGRGQLDEQVSFRGMLPNPTYLRHPLASLSRSVPTYFRQLLALDGPEMGWQAIAFGAAVKAMVALGLLALVRRDPADSTPGSQWVQGALVLSLQATAFVSIAGSYYKFGLVCCERHDTMRQCLLILTLLSGAALLVRALPPLGRSARLPAAGAGLLGLALVVLLGRQFATMEAAYTDWTRAVTVNHANWATGHAPGDGMVFLMAPMPPVVSGLTPPERGTFHADQRPPWLWELVMTFFAKRQIELKPLD